MAWVPPGNKEELKRLSGLLQEYELQNLNQKNNLDEQIKTIQNLTKRVTDLNKDKLILNKKVKSLENGLKFEKQASEGLKKRFNLLELEAYNLKEENINYAEELKLQKNKISELETNMHFNRSKRLQLMHENEKLLKENQLLSNTGSKAEEGALDARKRLQEKLEVIDSLNEKSRQQGVLIDAQSNEILELSREIEHLREKIMNLNKQLLRKEDSESENNKNIQMLQLEISRLRKEVISISNNNIEKSQAITARASSAMYNNRLSKSLLDKKVYSNDHFDSSDYYRAKSAFSRSHEKIRPSTVGTEDLIHLFEEGVDIAEDRVGITTASILEEDSIGKESTNGRNKSRSKYFYRDKLKEAMRENFGKKSSKSREIQIKNVISPSSTLHRPLISKLNRPFPDKENNLSTEKEAISFIMDQLSPLPLSHRAQTAEIGRNNREYDKNNNNTSLKESLNSVKKCYSMPNMQNQNKSRK